VLKYNLFRAGEHALPGTMEQHLLNEKPRVPDTDLAQIGCSC
jgi:hypothetical protein